MTSYDYAVLVVYFAFMLGISWIFRHFVRNVSDYFRGGAQMVWWMAGGSAFMVSFSAWTFTGAASKAYSSGWPIVVIFLANALGFVFNAAYFGPRFRQLRLITAVEAVRQRFGRGNEQVFTWLQIPLGTLYAGIWLNALGVFFSAVFGLDITLTIVVTGAAVLLMTLLGGSWAVVASDFIQVLVLMPVCLITTVLALAAVGGLDGFVTQLPAGHLDLSKAFSVDFLLLWCFAIFVKQFISTNNLLDASRYLCVKDSKHARLAGALGAALFLCGPLIWFIPPMVASITSPDLAARFPGLNNPSEAAFVAIAADVLPMGMLGLLVSGIFAATMSSMDSGLNRNAGIFIKNFYHPVVRRSASEGELLLAGKIATVVLGVLVISTALRFATLRELKLFTLMLDFGVLVALPFTIPLVWGVLIRKSPPWSGWSTVLVGFASSLVGRFYFNAEWARGWYGLETALDAASRDYWQQSVAVILNVIVGSSWFFFTCLFWKRAPEVYQSEVDKFFTNLNTPVDYDREIGGANDRRQESLIGMLCLAYGAFVCALALIPNGMVGRLSFLLCGGIVGFVGLLLRRRSRQIAPVIQPEEQPVPETLRAP
jgi:solute:Na+ symporter, SSS family